MGGKFWIFIVLLFGCTLNYGYGADPVLTWSSWTDSVGNTADANSDVTWAPIPIPANSTYKGGSVTYDSKGLGPFNSFAKAFINGAVFPDGISWDVIDSYINGTLITDVTTNYMDYVKKFAGYGSLIVIGFLFIFLFPLIGMCFCCCRCCCSNCGGAMKQNPKDADNHCKRRTFAVILLVLTTFIAAGMICVYISNDQMTDSLKSFDTSAANALDDINTFIDVFIGQIKHIAQDNFNFTRDVIYRDLDSIGYIIGIPARTTLKTGAGVDTAIDSALVLAQKVDAIATAMIDLNTSLTYVKDNATALWTAATNLKDGIEADKTNCSSPCDSAPDVSTLKVEVDARAFPDISNQIDKITSVQTQNLTSVILKAKQQFEDIPWTVENETISVVTDLKSTVSNFSSKLQPIIDQADKFKTEISGSFDIGSYKGLIANYTKIGLEYNTYRWYGGIGLASVILLIVLLLLVGLMFAVCGHRINAKPTERSCLSSCGGYMFMAAVGFVFIFSSLLMLLTIIIFIVGTPMHRFVCEPLTDPDLTDMETLLDKYLYGSMYGGSGSFLGRTLFQNGSHVLTLKKVLSDCEAGKSAYTAFDLSSLIDITALTNYSGSLNIDSKLDGINVDLSTLEILTPELKSQLTDLKTSADLNFTQFREQFSKDSLGINLTSLAEDLRNLSATIAGSDPTSAIKFFNHSTTADSINDNELADFNNALTDLESKLNILEAAINGTEDAVDTTLNAFNNTQNYLQANGSQVIKDEAKTFAYRLLKVMDSLINDTLDGLVNDIGSCTPVWNLYNDIIVISFCKYFVDSLNGFWFGFGWCIFFFLPSIIFATKLAKHYRRMKTHDFEDNLEKGDIPMDDVKRHNGSPVFKSNKVAHSDNFSENVESW